MKFAALAVAALMGVTDALRLSGEKLEANKDAVSKLMSGARKLDQYAQYQNGNYNYNYNNGNNGNDQGDNGDFEITGKHSIVFQSCESLSVQANFEDVNGDNGGDDDAYIRNIYNLYEQGAVRGQRSYVLFDVCLSDYCNNDAYKTTYIVDLATFVVAFSQFIPTKQANYCQGCKENKNYCLYNANKMYNDGNNAANNGAYASNNGQNYNVNNYNNNGGRKLQDNMPVEYIDCDRCSAYDCWNGNSNVDYSLDWMYEMATCEEEEEYPYYYNGVPVKMGFMCNAAGDGLEIAAFLDQDCTLYTNQIAYGNLMTQQDYMYWYNSRQHIEYMFNTGFSCYDPEVMYINPYDEQNGEYGDDIWGDGNNQNNNNNNGDENVEAAEYCTALWQSEVQNAVEPVSMSNCAYNYNNNGNQDGNQDENQNNYYQQSYTLSEEDAVDGYAVCNALTGMGGTGEHIYDQSSSGSMYSYSSGSKGSSENWEEDLDKAVSEKKSGRPSGGVATFFIILAIAAAAVGATYYVKSKKADDKEQPLVKEDDKGQLA